MRRAISDRAKDTLVYTCTMPGHRDRQTGAVYAIDTLVDVNDDIREVHEPLWVIGRKFRYSASEGAVTDLTMIRKDIIRL
jgi:prophage tail gpP-like protein